MWLPGRLNRMLSRMWALQQQFGANVPLLVHSDLVVVDASLRSFTRRFAPTSISIRSAAGPCPGCWCRTWSPAAHDDRPRVSPPGRADPAEAVMHDWWLALVAAAVGRIGWLAEPTVLYRQHQANRVGAKRWGPGYVLRHALELFAAEGAGMRLRDGQRQAAALVAHLGSDLPDGLRRTVMAYANLSSRNALARRILLLRHGIRKTGWARNLGMWIRI